MKVLQIWVLFFGSTEEARNYSCRISVKSKFGNEFNYTGPVHTIDKNYEEMVTFGSLLGIGIDAVKRSLDEENQFEFEVTIRNLKEEAKDENMESGVSDGGSL